MENNSPVLASVTIQINKYEPHKVANGKNYATLFVASDDIDMAELQRYRQQTQTECLIAINGTGKDLACLKLADNVITCLPHEIEIVMFAFKSLVLNDSFMGLIGMILKQQSPTENISNLFKVMPLIKIMWQTLAIR